MSYIQVRFTAKEHDGKVSLWVNGTCIWELRREELTLDVQEAIMNAYELGARDAAQFVEIPKLVRDPMAPMFEGLEDD